MTVDILGVLLYTVLYTCSVYCMYEQENVAWKMSTFPSGALIPDILERRTQLGIMKNIIFTFTYQSDCVTRFGRPSSNFKFDHCTWPALSAAMGILRFYTGQHVCTVCIVYNVQYTLCWWLISHVGKRSWAISLFGHRWSSVQVSDPYSSFTLRGLLLQD